MPSLQKFNYNPNQPIESQIASFLAGRNPYGTYGKVDLGNSAQFAGDMSAPDEGGNTHVNYRSLDPDVSVNSGQGATEAPYFYGGYRNVPWVASQQGSGVNLGDGNGFSKPDNMYGYDNMYYDPKFGLITQAANYRDPHAVHNAWLDAGMMAAVGGAGFGAAAAANAAAGAGGASFMGQGVPTLARTALNAVGTLDNRYNPDLATFARPTLTGGSNVVNNNGAASAFDPLSTQGQPNGTAGIDNPGSEGSGFDLGSFITQLIGGGGGLGTLANGLLSNYSNNKNNSNYMGDINQMIGVGTAGVQNNDRAGARGLVSGVYDGSISPDQVLQRVPGLKAISDRGYDDIARQMSAHGDADPASSARMREYTQFNSELTTKAYGDEMNRAMQVGGYNFNPGVVAGHGMDALGRIYAANQQNSAGLLALANRGAAGGAAGGASGGILGQILRAFSGGSSGGGSNGMDLLSLARSLGLNPGEAFGSGTTFGGMTPGNGLTDPYPDPSNLYPPPNVEIDPGSLDPGSFADPTGAWY